MIRAINIFKKKSRKRHRLFPIQLSTIFFLCMMFFFLYGIQSVSVTTSEKQLESLENAIHRSIIQCYALEGTYPPSLDYLKEHYGITYDEDTYLVDYTSIGSNIMPDVTILFKE